MALAGILGAFGLSGAAGLNAYIPLLLVAVLGRLGVVFMVALRRRQQRSVKAAAVRA